MILCFLGFYHSLHTLQFYKFSLDLLLNRLDSSGHNKPEQSSERAQDCFNNFIGSMGRNKNIALFYFFLQMEGQSPRIGATRRLSTVSSSDLQQPAVESTNVPKKLRKLQQVVLDMMPKRPDVDEDVLCKKRKSELYEAKIETEKVNNRTSMITQLQSYMQTASFRHLAKTEQEKFEKKLHKLLGVNLLSDLCSNTADV